MRSILIAVSLLVFFATSAFSQSNDEYANTLKRMFEVSGTEESYKTAIKQTLTMLKQQYTNVDQALWDEMQKEFLQTSLDDLTAMLVPVYQKYLTKSDLEAVISFYDSGVGKKFAESTPLIMQESMEIGQRWGMQIGQRFQQKMEEKGY